MDGALNFFTSQLATILLFQRIKKEQKETFALIIDGATLGHLSSGGKELQKEFCKVCLKCEAVLCCRMSPAQKAEVSFTELGLSQVSTNLFQINFCI